jgi:hypothetical protein
MVGCHRKGGDEAEKQGQHGRQSPITTLSSFAKRRCSESRMITQYPHGNHIEDVDSKTNGRNLIIENGKKRTH